MLKGGQLYSNSSLPTHSSPYPFFFFLFSSFDNKTCCNNSNDLNSCLDVPEKMCNLIRVNKIQKLDLLRETGCDPGNCIFPLPWIARNEPGKP